MEEDKSADVNQSHRQLLELEDRSVEQQIAANAEADEPSSQRAGDKGEEHAETLESAIPAASANDFAYLNARKSIQGLNASAENNLLIQQDSADKSILPALSPESSKKTEENHSNVIEMQP